MSQRHKMTVTSAFFKAGASSAIGLRSGGDGMWDLYSRVCSWAPMSKLNESDWV